MYTAKTREHVAKQLVRNGGIHKHDKKKRVLCTQKKKPLHKLYINFACRFNSQVHSSKVKRTNLSGIYKILINPLTPGSDQHVNSPQYSLNEMSVR